MQAGLTVGDFSRITHLSVKTLRHYHEVGLLEPATVDGPLREYYLRGAGDTPDEAEWRTEIGWPIFRADAGARGTSARTTRG